MRIFLLFFFLFILQLPAAGQARDVEALLRREMRERRIRGMQVAVVQNQRIVLLKSFGTADIQHFVPTTNKTIFPIYSCTKAFTGVAIMQLVEEGKVDLNAPVSRYLDGLPEPWQPITIRQLLTHVSGLPNILSVLDPVTYGVPRGMSEEQVWTKLKSLPISAAPGERFSYNQTNYALLGKVIDKLSGRPLRRDFHRKTVWTRRHAEHRFWRFA
jgi:CubicO group peptidase (beta-lactamase class C family)